MSPVAANSFVLFPIGKKRFALPAECVTELARPDRLQTFPHTTPLLIGVLVRRAHIIPVCDIAEFLVGPNAPARKFYLIANRTFVENSGRSFEWTAIPVSGECELVNVRPVLTPPSAPDYVTGMLQLPNEIVEIVDLNRLISRQATMPLAAETPKLEVLA